MKACRVLLMPVSSEIEGSHPIPANFSVLGKKPILV
jgi:hypothetical protein